MLLFLIYSVMQVNKKDPGDEAWVFVFVLDHRFKIISVADELRSYLKAGIAISAYFSSKKAFTSGPAIRFASF